MTNATQTTRTNLIEKYNDDIIFIECDFQQGDEKEILVGLKSWFTMMGVSQTYNSYGIQNDFEHQDECEEDESGIRQNCECEEFEVRAYNYWNGNNFSTITIEAEWDVNYSEITDDDEVKRYRAALENATNRREAGTGYQKWDTNDENITITRSQWQDAWDLYTLQVAD